MENLLYESGKPEFSDKELAEKVMRNYEFFTRTAKRIEEIKCVNDETKSAVEVVLDIFKRTAKEGGINDAVQRKWVESNFENRDCLGMKYAEYARNMGTSREVKIFIDEALNKDGEEYDYIRQMMGKAPLFGLVTASLYDNAKEPRSQMKLRAEGRLIENWYPELIEKSAKAHENIADFFETLVNKSRSGNQTNTLFPLLTSLKKSIQLNLMEFVNLANCYAIDLLPKNNAVFYATCGFKFKNADEMGAASKQLLDLKIHKVFKPSLMKNEPDYTKAFAYIEYLYGNNPEGKNMEVPVPVLVNVMDVVFLIDYFSRYWQEMVSGIKSAGKQNANNGNEDPVKCIAINPALRKKNPGMIQLREEDGTGQAQMAIIGQNRFKGFDVRLDKEAQGLILDIGSAKADHAIRYAKIIGALSDNHEIEKNYDKICGKKHKNSKVIFPSVVKTEIRDKDAMRYTMGSKAALVAAVAMRNGQIPRLQNSEMFTYNMRDLKFDRFAQDFAVIVKTLAEVLLKDGI